MLLLLLLPTMCPSLWLPPLLLLPLLLPLLLLLLLLLQACKLRMVGTVGVREARVPRTGAGTAAKAMLNFALDLKMYRLKSVVTVQL